MTINEPSRQVSITIRPEGAGAYRVSVHTDGTDPSLLSPAALAPGVEVNLGARRVTLGEVRDWFATKEIAKLNVDLDERGQLQLGRHLYQETLGRLGSDGTGLPDGAARVRILCPRDDEHLIALPWVLLADGDTFLVQRDGWTIELGVQGERCPDHGLPQSPAMLIAAPCPSDWKPTQAGEHLDELESLLAAGDAALRRDERIKVVRTLDDLRRAVAARHYPVFYFYGHGAGDQHRSRLVFEDADGQGVEVAMSDLTEVLAGGIGGPPSLAYLNCCRGDTGGVLGAGRMLGRRVPAVITNRTLAAIGPARVQAQALWRALLIEAEPPHTAVAALYRRLSDQGLSRSRIDWMTPVLHAGYARWTSHPPPPPGLLDRADPNWQERLDRRHQIGAATQDVHEMLDHGSPRCLFQVWYGLEGQGVVKFQKRLSRELTRRHREVQLVKLEPPWPDHTQGDAFASMFCRAFGVQHLDQIGGRIREKAQRREGQHRVLYVSHAPIQPGHWPDIPALKKYAVWCDTDLRACLETAGAFAVIGVPQVVRGDGARGPVAALRRTLARCFPTRWAGRSPAEHFRAELQATIDLTTLNATIVHLLEGLESIDRRDLREFLTVLGVSCRLERIDRLLDDVLRQSGGRYDATLDALAQAVERRWETTPGGRGPFSAAPDKHH